jgi:vacuolar-type H+-ATPase subunit E/Vma4
MQKQKIFNEVFRKTCEKALLKIKNIHSKIEQEIKNIKANNNNRVVTKFINIFEEVRKIKQNISNTFVEEKSFANAKIIQDLNLSISSFKTK